MDAFAQLAKKGTVAVVVRETMVALIARGLSVYGNVGEVQSKTMGMPTRRLRAWIWRPASPQTSTTP